MEKKLGPWELPSKEVLNVMYKKKEELGGFTDYNYWSSSEYSSYIAWLQTFFYGYQYIGNKYNYKYVRPVRALPFGHNETDRVIRVGGVEYQVYVEDVPEPMTWKEAKEWCKGLN